MVVQMDTTMKTIITKRLVIRSLTRCDIDDVFDIMSDTESARAADFAPMESLSDAECLVRCRNNFYFSNYGICEKGSDKVIGLIQRRYVRRVSDGLLREAEVGYILSKDYRGKGYMTEALDAFCRKLFDLEHENEYEEDDFHVLHLNILPTNEASLGVARRVGFRYVEEKEDDKEQRLTDLRPLDRYQLSRCMLACGWIPRRFLIDDAA